MIKATAMLCLAMCLSATAVQAEPASSGPLLKKDKLSIGAGIVRNTIDVNMPGFDNSEIGYQFFAAYDLDKVNLIEGAHSSLELGYMDYGFNNRNSGGLWTTYVLDGAIRENFGWVARLGLDLGDDSGLMFGAGVGFKMNNATQLRVEYVIRDEIDSLQFNLIFHL